MTLKRAVCIFLLASGLASCASTDRLPSGPAPPPPDRPLPHSVCLHVHCKGDELEAWGTEEEWREDLVNVLREARVSEFVFHAGAVDRDPEDADLRFDIFVAGTPPREPNVEASGAVLDVLAYVTIPLLPIWIRDVWKDPGLSLELTASYEERKPVKIGEPRRVDTPEVLTSLNERVPFISWTTLGAILVPPFVYTGDERSAHMEESLGRRVRTLAAVEVARAAKTLRIEPELLRNFELSADRRGAVLSLEIEKNVGEIAVRLGKKTGSPWKTEYFELRRSDVVRRSYVLPPGVRLVRIEAVSLSVNGLVRCYTLSVPEAAENEQG